MSLTQTTVDSEGFFYVLTSAFVKIFNQKPLTLTITHW